MSVIIIASTTFDFIDQVSIDLVLHHDYFEPDSTELQSVSYFYPVTLHQQISYILIDYGVALIPYDLSCLGWRIWRWAKLYQQG